MTEGSGKCCDVQVILAGGFSEVPSTSVRCMSLAYCILCNATICTTVCTLECFCNDTIGTTAVRIIAPL